nr:hypothetical protein [uncultured Albidiferax sp.]
MSDQSVQWLVKAIQRLPADTAVSMGTPGYNNYTTQKAHWLGWLNPTSATGTYPRADAPNRNARYVFNHIMEPKMLLWLVSAAQVEVSKVQAASQAASSAASMAGASAAIRKIVPWQVVAAALERSTG